MNALDRLRARLRVGTELTCLENTYIPGRAGYTAVLTSVGKSVATGRVTGVDGGRDPQSVLVEVGSAVYWSLPTRVRDVEWLDGDTVRWALDGARKPVTRLDGHTVTYRVTDPASLPQEGS